MDSSALRHNLAAVRRLAPSSRVMAIIKANGYGHGLVAVAKALVDADAFGVARLEEGLALREAGIEKTIVLLEGVFSRNELNAAALAKFEIVVHAMTQIELLEASSHAGEFVVWLKVDTGMNRLGFRVEEFSDAWQRLERTEPRALRLMTHLSAAESRDGSVACEQIDAFRSLTDAMDAERTIANSAGLILWDEARTEWVRPGLMLYGISPVPGVSAGDIGLQPVMTLSTQLISVRSVHVGETVGYNGTWQATRESKIGIAAVGYGDGYPRNMRSGTPVLVNGRETVVVGRVSMDMTAVDVTEMDADIGDPVTLWGEGLPAERVAPYADTIAYELVCGISQRVAVEWK
ncbi:MAG TPA: alanine racemase [Steroidobacteraceae bacterium]|nr:alanine racemase [Steroidobacteraceae bacterium]